MEISGNRWKYVEIDQNKWSYIEIDGYRNKWE